VTICFNSEIVGRLVIPVTIMHGEQKVMLTYIVIYSSGSLSRVFIPRLGLSVLFSECRSN
jgi:hypothetical protein